MKKLRKPFLKSFIVQLLTFAFVLICLSLSGHYMQVNVSAASPVKSAFSNYASATLLQVPPSQEVTDHEFWKIVDQLKPEPSKVISKSAGTLTATSEVTAVLESGGKLAKYGAKGGGAVLVVVTFLAFPDDLSVPNGEIYMPGAASDDYQRPSRSSPKYSSKHSFNKSYRQYYVRAYTATGSRSHPHIRKGLPMGLVYVTLSSEQRDADDGCGKNGWFGNRWRDSQAYFNEQGWAYFPDCRKDNRFKVKFSTFPRYFNNARIGRTIQNLDYKGSQITNITYYIDDTTGSKSKPQSKPNPRPNQRPSSNSRGSELQRRKDYLDAKNTILHNASSEVNQDVGKLNSAIRSANSLLDKATKSYNNTMQKSAKYEKSKNIRDYNKFKQQAREADTLYKNASSSQQNKSDLYGKVAESQKKFADSSYFFTEALSSYNQLVKNGKVRAHNNKTIANQKQYESNARDNRKSNLHQQWQSGQNAELLRRERAELQAYSNVVSAQKTLSEKESRINKFDTKYFNALSQSYSNATAAHASAVSIFKALNKTSSNADFKASANSAIQQLSSTAKKMKNTASAYDEYATAKKSYANAARQYADAIRFKARMDKDKNSKRDSYNTAQSWDNSASSAISSSRMIISTRDLYDNNTRRIVITYQELQHDLDKANEDECIQQQQQANNSPGGYETPSLRGKINKNSSAIAKSKPNNKDSVELIDVVASQSNNPATKPSDSQKCKELEKSRQIIVEIAPKTFIEGISDRITNVKVELYGGVSCKSGNVQRTSTQGIAQFNNCSRNGFSLRLSNLQNYWDIKPIDNTRTLGARVESSQSSRIRVFTQPYKPYPSNWVREFSIAANQYWLKRHSKGVPRNDYKFGHLNTKPADYRSIFCKPGSAALKVLYENPTGEWASAPPFGAKNELCKISIASPDLVPATSRDKINTKSWACLLYVHEYGHLLGYEDITGSMPGATTKDIMFNHLLNAGEDPMIKRQLMNDTLCPEDTRVISP